MDAEHASGGTYNGPSGRSLQLQKWHDLRYPHCSLPLTSSKGLDFQQLLLLMAASTVVLPLML